MKGKAGAIVMGLVILLGGIAIVNGLWSKTLKIDGTVTTGDVNADWDCIYTNDDGIRTLSCPDANLNEPVGDNGADPHGSFSATFDYSDPFVVKDVAECTAVINTTDKQFASVSIKNAYPSYECKISFALSNTGSIPFNFYGATITLPETTDPADKPLELLDGTCQLLPAGAEFVQVDPGKEHLASCTVHVRQPAAQSTCTGSTATGADGIPRVTENCGAAPTSYNFSLWACVAQWNEDTSLADCQTNTQHEGPDADDPAP